MRSELNSPVSGSFKLGIVPLKRLRTGFAGDVSGSIISRPAREPAQIRREETVHIGKVGTVLLFYGKLC